MIARAKRKRSAVIHKRVVPAIAISEVAGDGVSIITAGNGQSINGMSAATCCALCRNQVSGYMDVAGVFNGNLCAAKPRLIWIGEVSPACVLTQHK